MAGCDPQDRAPLTSRTGEDSMTETCRTARGRLQSAAVAHRAGAVPGTGESLVRGWRGVRLVAVIAIGVSVLAGCGGKTAGGGGEKSVKVGLAYDIGGRGDKSFNDAAYAGLQRVRQELSLDV